MKPKERVLRAIAHQPTDRIPRGEIFIDDAVVKDFLKCDHVNFDQRRNFIARLGLDMVCLQSEFISTPAKGALPEAAHVKWVDIDKWVKDTDLFIFILLDGSMGWGVRLFGFERFMINIAREDPELYDFIHAVEQFNLDLAETASSAGVMGIIIADDIAYQKGLLVSPVQLRKLFFPSLARQVKSISAMNMPVFFHSDGNIREVLEDIVAAGFNGFQGLESAAGMDILSIKRRFGNRLCLWGNLDPNYLVMPYDRPKIQEQMRRILSVADHGKGFIFGTSSGLYKGMIPENLKTVYSQSRLN